MSRLSFDLTGEVYNYLTVITRAIPRPADKQARWRCRCVCGNLVEILASDLKHSRVKSCGQCKRQIARDRTDWTGHRFGELTVLRESIRERKPGDMDYWFCRCSCGTQKDVRGADMRNGKIQSCGCLRKKLVSARRTIHGESQFTGSRHKEYQAWKAMLRRCNNPNTKDFRYYGGADVTVDPEWIHDFEAFFRHIGPAPSEESTVDRIDPFGSYIPGNIRWATRKQQRENQRKAKSQLQLTL